MTNCSNWMKNSQIGCLEPTVFGVFGVDSAHYGRDVHAKNITMLEHTACDRTPSGGGNSYYE
jgi:hypothetical protein